MNQLPQKNPLQARPAGCSHSRLSSAESLSMDGFWMEVEQIQQRNEPKEEDGSGGEGRLPEGEEPWRGLLGGRGRRVRGPDTNWNLRELSLLLGLVQYPLHWSFCSTLALCYPFSMHQSKCSFNNVS